MINNRFKIKPHHLILLFLVIFVVSFSYDIFSNKIGTSPVVIADNLKSFTKDDLLPYDGTDDNKPIYIALNGFVYDVSDGRDFYRTDGGYHYLAGRDSSVELNIVGGGIIKSKYPVIGKYIK